MNKKQKLQTAIAMKSRVKNFQPKAVVAPIVIKQKRPTRNQLCPHGIKCKNCPEHSMYLTKRYKSAGK